MNDPLGDAGHRRRGSATTAVATTLSAALVAVTVAGCGSTASERTAYRQSAVSVLDATLGEARTAELAGRLWLDGSSTWAVTHVAVGASDTSIGADVDWFAGQQPPTPADDELRATALDALDAATAAVEQVRIRVERSDEEAATSALDRLRLASAELERLAEEWR